MTTPDPTRSKAIEVIVGALCAGTTCDRDCADVDHRPCDDAFCAWQKDAERVLAHLHAEGMAVVPGWQSIETKPRDHFPVLVWSEKLGQVVAFLDVTWAWWPCPAIEPLSSAPTHWRPLLPASPYGKASMQEGSAEAQSAVANTTTKD